MRLRSQGPVNDEEAKEIDFPRRKRATTIAEEKNDETIGINTLLSDIFTMETTDKNHGNLYTQHNHNHNPPMNTNQNRNPFIRSE